MFTRSESKVKSCGKKIWCILQNNIVLHSGSSLPQIRHCCFYILTLLKMYWVQCTFFLLKTSRRHKVQDLENAKIDQSQLYFLSTIASLQRNLVFCHAPIFKKSFIYSFLEFNPDSFELGPQASTFLPNFISQVHHHQIAH